MEAWTSNAGEGQGEGRTGWAGKGAVCRALWRGNPTGIGPLNPTGGGTTALILLVMVPRHSTDSSSSACSQGREMQPPGRSGEGLYAPQHYTGSPSFT